MQSIRGESTRGEFTYHKNNTTTKGYQLHEIILKKSSSFPLSLPSSVIHSTYALIQVFLIVIARMHILIERDLMNSRYACRRGAPRLQAPLYHDPRICQFNA